jgi:hypothetical protein
MFRKIRIFILLIILAFVALNTWLDRSYTREWKAPLQVALYPVNADGSSAATEFINTLSRDELEQLETFFDEEAQRYNLNVERPFRFVWAAPLKQSPPLPPTSAGTFAIMQWSLALRWFSWRAPNPPGPTPIIKMFVLFHDPAKADVLPDSTGLSKGLVGLAHVFASKDMRRANLVIIAHELLHTLTATDKYDLATNQPLHPDGFADPNQEPLYPQTEAELMAGRIAISPHEAQQPTSLQQVLIGPLTAREIDWAKP